MTARERETHRVAGLIAHARPRSERERERERERDGKRLQEVREKRRKKERQLGYSGVLSSLSCLEKGKR